jgi:mitochondrial fission protein ELM1
VAPWPDLVISAGRRTVPVARWLRRRNPTVVLAHLMWPGSTRDLDLVAVPEHDRVAGQARVMRTIGAPSRVTRARLTAAAAGLAPRLAALPRPHIACLVGGSRGRMRFAPQDAIALAQRLNRFAHARGGSLLVTTSRRTGRACEQSLAAALEAPHLLDRFGSDDSLYLGMLGCADAVVVTADSASLCSEACATGQPVFLHTPRGSGPHKLAALHKRLEQLGHLRPLGAPWPDAMPPPLNPAAMVAAAIRDLLPGMGTPR